MKAFVMKKIGKVGVMDKERPTCGPLDAILRPTRGLICTSDVHTVHGAVGERQNLTNAGPRSRRRDRRGRSVGHQVRGR
jgi:threonine dehydrogenase-like Zn-dependent dehydrogenase